MKFIFQDVKCMLQDAKYTFQDVKRILQDVQYKITVQIKKIKALPRENRDACEAGSCSNGGRPLPLFR